GAAGVRRGAAGSGASAAGAGAVPPRLAPRGLAARPHGRRRLATPGRPRRPSAWRCRSAGARDGAAAWGRGATAWGRGRLATLRRSVPERFCEASLTHDSQDGIVFDELLPEPSARRRPPGGAQRRVTVEPHKKRLLTWVGGGVLGLLALYGLWLWFVE